MHTTLDCIPCLMRLALRTARQVTEDENLHEEVVREAAAAISNIDLRAPPPVMAAPIYALIRKRVGVDDPLRAMRERDNRLALALVPRLRQRISRAVDPLGAALRISAAGNAIDFAACDEVGSAELERGIDEAMSAPLDAEILRFRQALQRVDELLWLADNAGEIVLDGLLIEQLPTKRVTLAVRGGPALNDALMTDAQAAGLPERCRVIDNGSSIPGTVLEDCSDGFVQRFRSAPLIVAKGQGNFETLSHTTANLLFILKVKCPTVAAELGRPLGSIALVWAGEE